VANVARSLAEFNPQMRLIMGGRSDEVLVMGLDELLPEAFVRGYLDQDEEQGDAGVSAEPHLRATKEPVRSGFVALVGRPNAGKSTLVNAVVGSKVSITSDTPQTTRHRLRAIVDTETPRSSLSIPRVSTSPTTRSASSSIVRG
jgi:hypothetical protein